MDASFLQNTSPTKSVDHLLRRQASRIKSAVRMFASVDQAQAATSDSSRRLRLSPAAEYHGHGKFREAVQLINDVPDMKFMTIDVQGWDDHVNIGAVGGKFAARIEGLSRALKTFVDDLDDNGLLQKTTIVVMSEFGRRVAENSSKGLDHGRGGLVMVIGDGVKSQVYAPDFSLLDASLDQGCLPVALDYRHILAEILEEKMGVVNVYDAAGSNSTQAANDIAVFPGLTRQNSFKIFRA
jgi:uncharacterized protein (DUF1501 family)